MVATIIIIVVFSVSFIMFWNTRKLYYRLRREARLVMHQLFCELFQEGNITPEDLKGCCDLLSQQAREDHNKFWKWQKQS